MPYPISVPESLGSCRGDDATYYVAAHAALRELLDDGSTATVTHDVAAPYSMEEVQIHVVAHAAAAARPLTHLPAREAPCIAGPASRR